MATSKDIKDILKKMPEFKHLQDKNGPISEEDIDQFKKKLRGDKRTKPLAKLLDNFKTMSDTRANQSQDPDLCVENTRGMVTPKLLQKFPNSPTAQRHMEVLHQFIEGMEILENYKKNEVASEYDCQLLEGAFRAYAKGLLVESHMMKYYGPPLYKKTELLVQYCKLRPHDYYAELLKIQVYDEPNWKKSLTLYEASKNEIIAHEILVKKCLPYKAQESVQDFLHGMYHLLASMYVRTDQTYRAQDAFKKALSLKPNDILAIYGLAFCSVGENQEEAVKMLEKYFELAPKCDEKYPNAHYLMADVYLLKPCSSNIKLARKFYERGLEAERFRLPFMPPDIPFKDSVQVLLNNLSVTE